MEKLIHRDCEAWVEDGRREIEKEGGLRTLFYTNLRTNSDPNFSKFPLL